jgi:hypothetical protein
MMVDVTDVFDDVRNENQIMPISVLIFIYLYRSLSTLAIYIFIVISTFVQPTGSRLQYCNP